MVNEEKFYYICEKIYDELYVLKSIIKTTLDSCTNKELQSLNKLTQLQISEERNIYINMLNLAIEHVDMIENINDDFESYLNNALSNNFL